MCNNCIPIARILGVNFQSNAQNVILLFANWICVPKTHTLLWKITPSEDWPVQRTEVLNLDWNLSCTLAWQQRLAL